MILWSVAWPPPRPWDVGTDDGFRQLFNLDNALIQQLGLDAKAAAAMKSALVYIALGAVSCFSLWERIG